MRIVTSAAVFVERNETIEVMGEGYSPELGGTFVTRSHATINVPLSEAVSSLLSLFDDWLFATPSDKSRALASMLSPALRLGKILPYDFPILLAEAEESQSGKSFMQHVFVKVYGTRPKVVNKKNQDGGGVGSLDENIADGLLSGEPLLMFENIRQNVNSQILESAIRGVDEVQVRRPYSAPQSVRTDRVLWLMTSNKAEVTLDLANRSIITRLKKQEAGYTFRSYTEGSLKEHVTANDDYYISCVLAVIREWYAKGKPRKKVTEHDFKEWSGAFDWIVQEIFGLAPLLTGHKAEQQRISNPNLNFLRDVALALKKDNGLGKGYGPSEIALICGEHGIEIPGIKGPCDPSKSNLQVGSILRRLFKDTDAVTVADIEVSHTTSEQYNVVNRHTEKRNIYFFR